MTMCEKLTLSSIPIPVCVFELVESGDKELNLDLLSH